MSEWKSTDDCLPILDDDNTSCNVLFYIDCIYLGDLELVYHDDEGKPVICWYSGDYDFDPDDVTHWRPLPDPPETP